MNALKISRLLLLVSALKSIALLVLPVPFGGFPDPAAEFILLIAALLAMVSPLRYWPVVATLLTGRLVLFVQGLIAGAPGWLPAIDAILALTNWFLLMRTYEDFRAEDDIKPPFTTLRSALTYFKTQYKKDVLNMSRHHPVLLVFLRHAGCTFCREAAARLSALREQITPRAHLVFVHMMADDNEAADFFSKYGMADVPRIADPRRMLYKMFHLQRGSLTALFGFKVIVRGLWAGIVKGHGVGTIQGDGFQMPGVFVIRNGEVTNAKFHRTAADLPDYLGMLTESRAQ